MIDQTLRLLDSWYREPTQGGDRPKLLSKLSVIELCGWLEGEFDRMIKKVDTTLLKDPAWVEKAVIDKTNGFGYAEHWVPMLQRLVGEVFVRRVEGEMDRLFPGDLEQLKSLLGTLWRIRCAFAHADINANIAAQQTFQAPSWVNNQYRTLARLLSHYENCVDSVVSRV